MKIRPIGALGTVTGSRTLIEHKSQFFLVDCGQDHASSEESIASVDDLGFLPEKLTAVFLTHAHGDHCGLLPILAQRGFKGLIYCTHATERLTRLALEDSAHLPGVQFTTSDIARLCFKPLDLNPGFRFGRFIGVAHNLTVAVLRTAHILGSVGFEFQFGMRDEKGQMIRRTISFSGDIGNNCQYGCEQALLKQRQYPSTHAEYVYSESTYGGVVRDPVYGSFQHRTATLRRVLVEARDRHASPTVVIPCFALHRMPEVMVDLHYVLERMGKNAEEETALMATVYVDSPLGLRYLDVYREELCRRRADGDYLHLNPELKGRSCAGGQEPDDVLHALFGIGRESAVFRCSRFEAGSPAVPQGSPQRDLRIILAGSGMCQSGRVTEHLRRLLPYPSTTVIMVGHQNAGTPGARLLRRAKNPLERIELKEWKLGNDDIKAVIKDMSPYYSGHADQAGLLDFILHRDCMKPYSRVKRVFLVHGEEPSRQALKRKIEELQQSLDPQHRQVEAVETPGCSAGWFDLTTNTWSSQYLSDMDDRDSMIAALRRQVAELEARSSPHLGAGQVPAPSSPGF